MTTATPKSFPRWGKWLVYLFLIAAISTLIFSQLPSGFYPTDLSRVGTGKPALVLAHDINSMGGMEVMALLDKVRDEFSARIEFIVAHLGEPEAKALAQRYGAVNGSIMLFLKDGRHLRTVLQPQNTRILREVLEQTLADPAR